MEWVKLFTDKVTRGGKMKKMGIFKRLPLCDIKNIHLSSYGYKFFNINYAECETLLNELDFKILKDIAGIMYISIDGLTNEFEPTIYNNDSRSLALEDLNDEFVESLFNNANIIYKDAIILSRIYDIKNYFFLSLFLSSFFSGADSEVLYLSLAKSFSF